MRVAVIGAGQLSYGFSRSFKTELPWILFSDRRERSLVCRRAEAGAPAAQCEIMIRRKVRKSSKISIPTHGAFAEHPEKLASFFRRDRGSELFWAPQTFISRGFPVDKRAIKNMGKETEN